MPACTNAVDFLILCRWSVHPARGAAFRRRRSEVDPVKQSFEGRVVDLHVLRSVLRSLRQLERVLALAIEDEESAAPRLVADPLRREARQAFERVPHVDRLQSHVDRHARRDHLSPPSAATTSASNFASNPASTRTRACPTSTTIPASTGAAHAFGTNRRNRGCSARPSRLDHQRSVDPSYPLPCAKTSAVSPLVRHATTRFVHIASVVIVALMDANLRPSGGQRKDRARAAGTKIYAYMVWYN